MSASVYFHPIITLELLRTFMSATPSTIKRHNHRIHPCETSKKQELLKHLTTLYSDKSILIISSANAGTTEIEDQKITLSNDAALEGLKGRQWDILISFDLPAKAEEYLTRFACAKEMALILVDEKEQTLLYPIEKLLGKNIKQEIIKGFEPKAEKKKAFIKHRPTKSQERSADDDAERKKNQIDKEKQFSAKKEWNKKPSSHDYRNKHTNPDKRAPRTIKIPKDKQSKES